MGIDFRSFVLPVNEIGCTTFIVAIFVSYISLFYTHHKRNKMSFSEIYPLVINYVMLCVISFLVLLYGIDCIIMGYTNNDEISEVFKELIIGFSVVSITIINFIFWIKRHLKDLKISDGERSEKAENDNKVAERVQIVIIISMIIYGIYNIVKYAAFIDITEKIRNIGFSILIILIAIFLVFSLNPRGLGDKIKSVFKK